MNLIIQILMITCFLSICNAESFNLNIVNDLKYSMTLKWYNFDGGLTQYNVIQPGSTISQETYADHKWLLENTMYGDQRKFTAGLWPFDRNGAYIKISVIKNVAKPTTIRPKIKNQEQIPNNNEPFTIFLKNDLPYDMTLFKLNSVGRLESLQKILAGELASEDTFVNAKLLVKNINEGDERKFKPGFGSFKKSNNLVKLKAISRTPITKPKAKDFVLFLKNDLPYSMILKRLDENSNKLIIVKTIFPNDVFSTSSIVGTKMVLVNDYIGDQRKFKPGKGSFATSAVLVNVSKIKIDRNNIVY